MAIGCFVDKSTPPSTETIQETLGAAAPLWNDLLDFVATQYKMPGDFSFGGKNYGWNMWYRKSGKSLASLYPQQGYFVAQVVLGRLQLEQALTLNLGEKVSRMLCETPMLHDGVWLFIPVDSEVDVNDIKQLLLVKKRSAR